SRSFARARQLRLGRPTVAAVRVPSRETESYHYHDLTACPPLRDARPGLYTRGMACALCETRRPRRFCPGVRGDICTTCCGTEREVTVSCPLDCEYLREARRHDRTPPIDPEQVPNRDIKVTEEFLSDNEKLLAFVSMTVMRAASETAGVVDFDVREAFDALIRTYRTLESGVYYESRPDNPLAARICDEVQAGLVEFRRAGTES